MLLQLELRVILEIQGIILLCELFAILLLFQLLHDLHIADVDSLVHLGGGLTLAVLHDLAAAVLPRAHDELLEFVVEIIGNLLVREADPVLPL